MKYLLDLRVWKQSTAILLLAINFANFADAQTASGGIYTLTQTSLANGGGVSANGIYTIEGTIGQSAVGTTQQNSPFKFQSGFWTAAQVFAPTVASVNLGGRVLTANGRGIRNVRVMLTLPDGTARANISSTFGYYHFENIPSGQTYILSARSKQFVFANPTQVVTLFEERGDVDFIAYSQP